MYQNDNNVALEEDLLMEDDLENEDEEEKLDDDTEDGEDKPLREGGDDYNFGEEDLIE